MYGFCGFRKQLAFNKNLVRTNGIMLWKLNDVSSWLDKKTETERVNVIQAVSRHKFRAQMLLRQKIREDTIEAFKKREQDEWMARGLEVHQEKAAKLQAMDVWEINEINEHLQLYNNAKQRLTAMRAVWQDIKTWLKKASLELPFPFPVAPTTTTQTVQNSLSNRGQKLTTDNT